MKPNYFNLTSQKKKGEFVRVIEDVQSRYEVGLFNIHRMILDLLKAVYYIECHKLRLIPEQEHEYNYQNSEIRFSINVYHVFLDITISKLIENKKNTWNYTQLLKVIRQFNWIDFDEITKSISDFAMLAKPNQYMRHNHYAHTSKQENQPYHLTFPKDNYVEIIGKAMEIFDMFLDGKAPYILSISETEVIDLRKRITSEEVPNKFFG